jgi:hypothetical protein
MLELYQLRIFLIISAGFIALYAFGILVAWWTKSEARRTMFQAKTAAAALLFAFALTAVASGFWRSHALNTGNSPASVSPIELQSTINMKSLPEQRLGDLF